jgi:hypothetical protein
MRVFLIALCACGSASTTAPAPTRPSTTAVAKKRAPPREPVDVITALGQSATESAWIAPGPAQLVLGGTSVQAPEHAPRLEVNVLEQQGNDVRVGVRLEHARFALWMSRSRLLSMIAKDHRIAVPGVFGPNPMHVVLRAGAQVQRLAVKEGTTQIRYVGALEAEGWVPDDLLVDRLPSGREKQGRVQTGRKQLMLTPGSVIRAEPKWAGQQLAILNQGYFVDEIRKVDDTAPAGPKRLDGIKQIEGVNIAENKRRTDDGWFEVSYEDGDIYVHGYASKQAPPGRTHKQKQPEQTPPLAPNGTARDGVCLHVGREPIGFIVGDRAVVVEPATRAGWSMVTIDTPWGPIAFEAKGAADAELATCDS